MLENFKSRLRNREPLVGTFIKTPSPFVTEVLAVSKLDVLCLDAEHAPFDRLAIDQCIVSMRSSDMPSLVRVQSAAEEHILNALDCGATGVLVPHVKSAESAAEIAKVSHFGARGRGYAGSTRAAEYTKKSMSSHLEDSAKNTVVIAQIEDVEALDCLDEIAAVSDIDCLFVGRIDLTVALGAESPKDEVVMEAVTSICKAAVSQGRAVGMFVGDLSEIPYWLELGASFFLLSSDHSFLQQGAEDLVTKFRSNLT